MKSAFRIDRLLSLWLFWPLARKRRERFTILMYHSVSPETSEGSPYYRTDTDPEVFARQMAFLRDRGYTVMGLHEALTRLKTGESPRGWVSLTFDDGFRDFHDTAFPVLRDFRFPATVFLATGFIGNGSRTFKGRPCMTWKQAAYLRREGIDFGAHTVSHPQLRNLSEMEVEYEVRQSKEEIEEALGGRVEGFSYPFAFPESDRPFVDWLRSVLGKAGYAYGVSTRIGTSGPADDRYFLRRIPVNSLDDTSFFRAKLEGGYDWLSRLQQGKKMLLTAGSRP